MFVVDNQLLQLSDRVSSQEEEARGLANRAINHLSGLCGQTGVWDIFITKHIEVDIHCQTKH